MFNKKNQSKGISPLIASVLLIAFTMSIAILAGPFFTDTLKTAQEGQNEQASSLLESAQSSLSIESIAYDQNSGNYTILLRNTGQNPIENYTVTAVSNDPTKKTYEETISPGEVKKFQLSTSTDAEEEEISIASSDGSTSTSTNLESVESGSAPSAPGDLQLTS